MVNLYPLENAVPHKTDKYELVHQDDPTPVLRRGFKFSMVLRFRNRGYDRSRDVIRLVFNFGPRAHSIKGTKAIIRVEPRTREPAQDRKEWYAGIKSEGPDSVTIEVMAAVHCPVGNWKLQVETGAFSTTDRRVFNYDKDVYILYNPWCCEDLVFMPEERFLDEYILADVGKIWVGPYGSSRGREWVFGQFDKSVLPAAMLMFSKSGFSDTSRGDPIKSTRLISKMVNSNDDDGILVGRWDGDYGDGTAPASWTGSVPILEEYLQNEESVCYGQCWVFSGVTTTICRALGIPSRVVSNLVSAHDTNASLSIDKYYDTNDEELDFDPTNPTGEDSIWNYHVWNDVYMARPDLPTGYGGWQAIDATPQETSDGVYQCGPTSLEAIKQGKVGFNYDVAFMVASVNADLMRWKEDPNAPMGYARIYCNKYHIGRMILTKKPFLFDPNGDKDREDITLEYKAKEGTEFERVSLMNAVRGLKSAQSFFSVPENIKADVDFDLVDLDKIKIGEDYEIVVNINNKSDEVRHIRAVLSSSSVFYTGVKAKLIKKAEGSFSVPPRSTETMRLEIRADDYLNKLVEYCIMKIYAIATVDETKETWADEDDFQVVKPTIQIQMPSKTIPIKKPVLVKLSFVNPLKKRLTNCKFQLAGPSLVRNQGIGHRDVGPGGLVEVETQMVPQVAGEQTIVATFAARELMDITGSVKVDVYDDED
ncbi:hemocyte protein-glutamine gamma-glutamyltransferase-like [Photinus pyralis]|nr:hemocyte protein-glutamine gamma-glutamyltransferase-like [Photinus pyralis]